MEFYIKNSLHTYVTAVTFVNFVSDEHTRNERLSADKGEQEFTAIRARLIALISSFGPTLMETIGKRVLLDMRDNDILPFYKMLACTSFNN